MDTAEVNLAAYQGKKIKFQHGAGESPVEIEGTVELVNGPAMLIKLKGSAMNKLIELKDIIGGVEVITEKPRELKARRLDKIGMSNSRFHLLDRHGYRLDQVNAMSDEQAYREHEGLDHDELGHFHADRETVGE